MNKAELIKGINLAIEGLVKIKVSIDTEGAVVGTAETAPVAEKKVASKKAEKEVVKEVENAGGYTKEQLDEMKYNDLKKLGASLGVKCTGTRDEITERILSAGATAEVEEAEEVKEDKKSSKKNSKVETIDQAKKRVGKKVAVAEEEPEEEEEEDDEVDFLAKAKEVAEELDKADIIEALKDVNIKATAKNYVQKLAEALEQGLIDLDDEEEEEEEADGADEEESSDDDEITADAYFSEFDTTGFNDPDNMTEERAEAVLDLVSGIIEAIDNEEIGEKEIKSYVEDNATEEEIELLGDEYEDEDLIKLYIELRKRMIDDEGVEHEPSDPYELNEKNACCGHELKYSKKNKQYICEICGVEYDED